MGKSSSVIQALRGLAAIVVVLCHLEPMLAPGSFLRAVAKEGGIGVDVFFVISGFVIAVSTSRPIDASPMAFVIRRLFRIVPLAWTALVLILLIIHADRGLVLRGFLLLPENPNNNMFPLNYPAWSLSYEMFFYALFGTSLAISHRFRCEICLIMIAGLSFLDHCLPSTGGAIRSFFAAYLFLEFGAGLVIARLIMAAPRNISLVWPLLTGALLVLAGLAISALRPIGCGFFATGGGFAVIIAGLLLIETYIVVAIPRWLDGLGDISYAIYISQVFAFIWVDSHVFWTPLYKTWIYKHTAGGSRAALILVTLVAIATLLHVLIEKPCMRLGRRVAKGLGRRAVSDASMTDRPASA